MAQNEGSSPGAHQEHHDDLTNPYEASKEVAVGIIPRNSWKPRALLVFGILLLLSAALSFVLAQWSARITGPASLASLSMLLTVAGGAFALLGSVALAAHLMITILLSKRERRHTPPGE